MMTTLQQCVCPILFTLALLPLLTSCWSSIPMTSSQRWHGSRWNGRETHVSSRWPASRGAGPLFHERVRRRRSSTLVWDRQRSRPRCLQHSPRFARDIRPSREQGLRERGAKVDVGVWRGLPFPLPSLSASSWPRSSSSLWSSSSSSLPRPPSSSPTSPSGTVRITYGGWRPLTSSRTPTATTTTKTTSYKVGGQSKMAKTVYSSYSVRPYDEARKENNDVNGVEVDVYGSPQGTSSEVKDNEIDVLDNYGVPLAPIVSVVNFDDLTDSYGAPLANPISSLKSSSLSSPASSSSSSVSSSSSASFRPLSTSSASSFSTSPKLSSALTTSSESVTTSSPLLESTTKIKLDLEEPLYYLSEQEAGNRFKDQRPVTDKTIVYSVDLDGEKVEFIQPTQP